MVGTENRRPSILLVIVTCGTRISRHAAPTLDCDPNVVTASHKYARQHLSSFLFTSNKFVLSQNFDKYICVMACLIKDIMAR